MQHIINFDYHIYETVTLPKQSRISFKSGWEKALLFWHLLLLISAFAFLVRNELLSLENWIAILYSKSYVLYLTWENFTGTPSRSFDKKALRLWGSQNTPPSKYNGPLVSYAWPLSLELWYVGKTLRGERLNGGWAHKWPKNSLSLNSEPNDATIILYPMKVFEMSKLCTFLKAICI